MQKTCVEKSHYSLTSCKTLIGFVGNVSSRRAYTTGSHRGVKCKRPPLSAEAFFTIQSSLSTINYFAPSGLTPSMSETPLTTMLAGGVLW